MKERQLIGMVDYIEWIKFQPASKDYLEQGYETPVHQKYGRICNFAKFLNQPLTLSMFVPCDEDGNVLEEPTAKLMNELGGGFSTNEEQNQLDDFIQEYQAAKERVIFEGFEVTLTEFGFTLNDGVSSKVDVVLEPDFMRKNINDLINYRLVYVTEPTYNKYFK